MEEDKQQKIKQYKKQYYETHFEKYKEYRKRYKEKPENQINMNMKFICPCGGSFIRRHKSEHYKTKKHQTYLNGNC